MTNTKKSLIFSALSLLLCCALLVGTTFAWFTDSVTNTGNTIQAGNLEIGFRYRALGSQGEYIPVPETAGETGKLFADQLWEPGYTNGLDLKVVNNGNLALRWQLYFLNIVNTDATDDGTVSDIADVLDVYLIGVDEDKDALTEDNKLGTLSELSGGIVTGGALNENNAETTFSVVLKMQESAGNTYQGCSVAIDVELRATQATYESDGFGNDQYDAAADGTPDNDWNTVISGSAAVSKPAEDWAETTTISVNGATAEVPRAAVDEDAETIELIVTPTTTPDGISVESGALSASYDITVTGLDEGNTTLIPVSLYIGKDLVNVKLYHKTTELTEFIYNAETGILSFETADFSPFTIVTDGKLVAYVGGVAYASFTKAVMAANNGGTVELAGDVDKPLTFDWTKDWANEGPSSSEPNTYQGNLYSYTIENVTLTSAGTEPVAVNGLNFGPGKVSAQDPTDASKSSYYKKLTINGLTVKNISFTDQVIFGSTSKGFSLISNVTFEDCSFDMSASEAKYKDALIINAARGKSEGDKYFTAGIIVRDCEFANCRRSIDFDMAKNTTITGCTFTNCNWGIYAYNTVGALNFTNNVLENGEGAIDINNVANDYAAYDNSSDITVSGNIMTGMTAKYICSTLYDNGRTAGKSSYNISDNYWDGADYNGFVIEGNYGPSKPEFISDTAPRASADPQ